MLKESDDLDMLGLKFDSKMTFEKNLRSPFRPLLKDLKSCGSTIEDSMLDCFFGDAFRDLSCMF